MLFSCLLTLFLRSSCDILLSFKSGQRVRRSVSDLQENTLKNHPLVKCSSPHHPLSPPSFPIPVVVNPAAGGSVYPRGRFRPSSVCLVGRSAFCSLFVLGKPARVTHTDTTRCRIPTCVSLRAGGGFCDLTPPIDNVMRCVDLDGCLVK